MNTERKTYSLEFKRNAVSRVLNGEGSSAVAKDLGLRHTQIDKWRRRFAEEAGKDDLEAEARNELLRLRQIEQRYDEMLAENDRLKAERELAVKGMLFLIRHLTEPA